MPLDELKVSLDSQNGMLAVPGLAWDETFLPCHSATDARLQGQPHVQDQLLDSFFGIDRGAAADSELQAEISELIAALETRNPTEAPNQVRV